VFAILEGTFLDHVKGMGIEAFSWLFGFGMAFGLLNALLFAVQPDVPLGGPARRPRLGELLRETFANRPLMRVMAFGLLWTMQIMAWPFYVVYMLEDLKMPFLGVGIITSVQILTMLALSPFWGRVVNRYGCRPVLIICTAILTPLCLTWLPMSRPSLVYTVMPFVHVVGGFAVAGLSVALNTLIYKVTPSQGRSMQFAVYSILVVLISAPMPTLGAYLPRWARAMGFHVDVRLTFAASMLFAIAALAAACRIQEPNCLGAADLLRRLPGHLRHPATLRQ
jgi:MFS family permease